MLFETAKFCEKKIIEKYGINHPYYTATELFAQKMPDGKKPICYISTLNRTAGKTTFLCLLSYYMYLNEGKQTVYLVRNTSEIMSYGSVYADANILYGWNADITTKVIVKDTIAAIYADGQVIAYVISLKKDVMVKKYSPLFRDVELIAEEEYQLEDGRYIKNEVDKMRSIYRSVARGGGEQSREVPIYLIGNPVTIMNPYLIEFGLSTKYSAGQKYTKNNRAVLEVVINRASARALQESAATELFPTGNEYDCGQDFLIKDSVYMEKCRGKTDYLFTLIYGKRMFGVRQYKTTGIVHVSNKHDPSFKKILAFYDGDRYQNIDMLERYDYTWNYIRNAYRAGKLRFDAPEAKEAIFSVIGVDLYS